MQAVSINPATGDEIARYPHHTDSEIDARLSRSHAAYRRHRSSTFAERSRLMLRVADLLEERVTSYGTLMTVEMGKPIAQAEAEVKKCAWVCRYYGERAEQMLADQPVSTDASRSVIAYQPIGPVLAVMPWNFPFWQVFRFAAPALMAGNAGLLKHASNVYGCAFAIEEVIRDAGFEPDLFQTLVLPSGRVEPVISDGRVAGATLTGSEAAGRSVGAAAGRAIKPSVLELGGSDAFIVLDDADLDEAAKVAVAARMQNNGQSCIAAKRFIAARPIAEAFADRFATRIEALSVGDPMDRAMDVGPLARADLREEVLDQIERALADGASLRVGGGAIDGPGNYVVPALIEQVRPGTVAFREEIFGPVASLIVADDDDHAVSLANDSPFGLGGCVFTGDAERGERVARALEVGCAFVNGMVKSDPRLPFGGVKESGYGRELAGSGIRAFTNEKTLWIA